MVTLLLYHTSHKKLNSLREGLKYENIEIITCEVYENIESKLYEINAITLYLEDSNKNMISELQSLTKDHPKIPIIIVDGRSEKSKLSTEFDAYFAEPVPVRNLALALKKLVCAMQMPKSDQWLQAYDLWLDLEHRYAKRNNKIIPLRNREFALLEFFVINQGKILTRSSILELVWDRNADLTSNTIDVHVNRLRRKIDDPFPDKLIHTVPYVGYKFEKKESRKASNFEHEEQDQHATMQTV